MNKFPDVLESINDLTYDQIKYLLYTAKAHKRDSGKFPTYSVKKPVIATCFLEHSTRTKNSFVLAIEKLGGIYLNFDPSSSSLQKGENLEETFLTLKSQGVDLCIIRTSVPGELHPFIKNPPFKIINGGDGMHQHPTQALLDIFTMIENGQEPKGKTVAIIGDCVHSRVCHSLIDLLSIMEGKVILCGPSGCLPKTPPKPNVELCPDINETIAKSDLLYLLRVQKERHKKFGRSHYFSDYHLTHGVTLERLKGLNRLLPVYHPGPANIGVEIGLDLIKSQYYFGYEQVKNSLFMRMALIQTMLLD